MRKRGKKIPLEIVFPLSLWQSAYRLRLLRNERRRQIEMEKKQKIHTKIERVKHDIQSKNQMSSVRKIPIPKEKGDFSIPETKIDKTTDELWKRKMEDLPDTWGRALESNYRKITDAQIVQGLLRRLVPLRKKKRTVKKKPLEKEAKKTKTVTKKRKRT